MSKTLKWYLQARLKTFWEYRMQHKQLLRLSNLLGMWWGLKECQHILLLHFCFISNLTDYLDTLTRKLLTHQKLFSTCIPQIVAIMLSFSILTYDELLYLHKNILILFMSVIEYLWTKRMSVLRTVCWTSNSTNMMSVMKGWIVYINFFEWILQWRLGISESRNEREWMN